MKDRFYSYLSILLSVILCGTVSAVFNAMNGTVSVLMCVLFSVCVAVVCLMSKRLKNIREGYDELWLNCMFLLERYEITKTNRHIITNYITRAHQESNEQHPPIHYVTKLNRLIKEKEISDVCFSLSASLRIFAEALGLSLIAFGANGMLSSAIRYFFADSPVPVLFWVSFMIALIGIAGSLFLVGGIDRHKVLAIVAGAGCVALIAGVMFVNLYRADGIDRRCDDITMKILEKGDGEIYTNYDVSFVSDFWLSVTNQKKKDVVELEGELQIYNINGTLLHTATVTLDGKIRSQATEKFHIAHSKESNEKAAELYYSKKEDLYITFKISKIRFEDRKQKTYPDSRLMEILPFAEGNNSGERLSSVEKTYREAVDLYTEKKYSQASQKFLTIRYYKLSSKYVTLCNEAILNIEKAAAEANKAAIYKAAEELMNAQKYNEAIQKFSEISDYKGSAQMIERCNEALHQIALSEKYLAAKELYQNKEYLEAYSAFYAIKEYEDSSSYLHLILEDVNTLAQSYADQGEYDAAHDLLESIGYSLSEHSANYSKLMRACAAAMAGNYQTAVSCGLLKIVLPEGITAIPADEFKGCEKLVEVVIPASVTSIGDNAFSGCVALEKLVLPQGLKQIGIGAFKNCDSLKWLILPAGLESIALYGFGSIDGEIHYEGTVDQWRTLEKTGPIQYTSKIIHCKDGNVNP